MKGVTVRVFKLLGNGESLGLRMKLESEGHRVDSNAPNPDCVVVDGSKYSGNTPAFNGGDWACSINSSSEYATTVLRTLGIISDAVDKGIAISVDVWFNGRDVQGINYSIVDYNLMEGGKGPITSGMGTVMWIGHVADNLFKRTVGKLLVALEKVDYKGNITMGMLVHEDKVQILNISAGINYNTMPILAELYSGKINDLIYGIASGVNKEMRYKSNLGMGVVLGVHPFPCTDCHHGREPLDIVGLNKHNLKHFWMDDPKAHKHGRLGMITARGDSVQGFSALRDAKRRVARTISNLTIPEVMYRLDIGNKVEHERSQLRKWQWL